MMENLNPPQPESKPSFRRAKATVPNPRAIRSRPDDLDPGGIQ